MYSTCIYSERVKSKINADNGSVDLKVMDIDEGRSLVHSLTVERLSLSQTLLTQKPVN